MPKTITVKTTVKAPLEKVWKCWVEPNHITQWAFALDDWEAPSAENDVRTGGRFKTVMRSKDKSNSFDFTGTYTNINGHGHMEYDIDDGRHVSVKFEEVPGGVTITEIFEPEHAHSEDMQRDGWQAILNNFKKHVENDR